MPREIGIIMRSEEYRGGDARVQWELWSTYQASGLFGEIVHEIKNVEEQAMAVGYEPDSDEEQHRLGVCHVQLGEALIRLNRAVVEEAPVVIETSDEDKSASATVHRAIDALIDLIEDHGMHPQEFARALDALRSKDSESADEE